MARTAKKASDKTSLAISIAVHIVALGGLAYLAHRAGFVPAAVYKITGIKPPEKPKPKPKPPEPPADVPPPKAADIVEETTTPPPSNSAPPTAAPATASAARSDAPPAAGGGVGNFFQAEARKPDAAPVRPVQGKPGTGAGNLEASKSTAAATAAKSAFDEASTKPSTIAAVLADRKNAASAQEAISAEQISRTGGGDVAQLTTKITGVVATESKQIVVRGLNDRYNVATLNGAEIPSADPRRRAPQLDLIPSAMVDRVVVSKTFTPDMQGGFAGGAVNIVTKSFPAKAFASVTLGSGFNTESSFNDAFLTSPGGELDWLAIDDGDRELTAAARGVTPQLVGEAQRSFNRNNATLAAQRLGQAEAVDAGLRSFANTDFVPTPEAPGPNGNFSISGGDSTWLFGKRFGWFGTLTYDRRFTFQEDAFRSFVNTDPDLFDGGPLQRRTEFSTDRAIQEMTWGAVASSAIELLPGHELSFSFLHNQSATFLNASEIGRSLNLGQFQPVPAEEQEFSGLYQISYQERFLRNYQVKGRHELRELAGAQLDWLVSMASTAESTPDQRFFPYVLFPTSPGVYNVRAQSPDLPSINQPIRFFRESTDENLNTRVDFTVPFTPGNGLESALKTGFNFSGGERQLRESRYEYFVPDNRFASVQLASLPSTINSAFDFQGQQFVTNRVGANNQRYFFGSADGRTQGINFSQGPNAYTGFNYEGSQDITAVYGMADLFVHPKFRLIGGARMEKTDMEVIIDPLFVELGAPPVTRGQIEGTDILPSLGGVFPITSNLNLRLGWSQTLARPTYREFSSAGIFDPETGEFIRGNPQLRRTQIENLDARAEWFPRPGELLSLAFFRKNLSDPIEPRVVDAQNGTVSFVNQSEAIVSGVEFEARQSLGIVDPLLQDVTLGGNFTWIDSEVKDVPYVDPATQLQVTYSRPLFDQPQYVLNADLTVEVPRTRTTLSFVYSRAGERLTRDGGVVAPNIYEQSFDTFDIFLSQRLGGRWRMRLGARNLIDPVVSQIFVNDFGQRRDFGGRYVYRSLRRGATYSLSVTCDF